MFGGRRKADIDNILVVEDEALIAFDNEHFLTDSGYHVAATVDNAQAAIAVLAEREVGLVLTDLALNGEGDGHDIARAAHRIGVPVLFVSGSSPPGDHHTAIGLLHKPYSDRDLLSAIEAAADIVAGRTPKKATGKLTLFKPADPA